MTPLFSHRIRLLAASLGMMATCVAAVPAMAQDAVPRNSKLVVGFSPGGPVDQAARLIAEQLGTRTKSTFIVDNRPGANAQLAATQVKNSPPDGATIFVSSSTAITMNPTLFAKTITYNPDKDFTPVAPLVEMPLILVVNANDPKMQSVKSLKDLVELAKRTPKGLNYGSSGNGGLVHIAAELLATRTGTNLVHIPYKGTAAAQAAILAKDVDMTFDALAVMPHIRAGTLRALAVSSNRRLAELPDVPTVEELGYGDFNVASWVGLFVPKATPRAYVEKLNAEVNAAMKDPAFRERLTVVGPLMPMSVVEFEQKIHKETQDLLNVIKTAKITVD
ncbi:Bug family tripartite tricarboxylate transporter substrate binding protein [Ottowia thiooxydans]|uniref:Bug family tripartite tricarboxylate transporter substrate binding protein n=1 Tax=Ottowia thiooxydans TaxID=219182 RepID=UPI0004158DA0|nr:tripartite tricarboxylate transporter substrate binding protein [Ottowia thiooxydans]